jgi:hypothetical protein
MDADWGNGKEGEKKGRKEEERTSKGQRHGCGLG